MTHSKNHFQNLIIEGTSYSVIESLSTIQKNPETKQMYFGAEICIEATEIQNISSWIMEGKKRKDFDLLYSKNKTDGGLEFYARYSYIGAICTLYKEEYDSEKEAVLLRFTIEAKDFIFTNDTQEVDSSNKRNNSVVVDCVNKYFIRC